MGAIYINTGQTPFQRGWIIRGNYLHDIGCSSNSPINCNGIYFDHGTSGGLIEDNYFNRIGIERKGLPTDYAVCLSGLHGIVRHNVFVNCPEVLTVSCKPRPEAYLKKRYNDYHWPEYFQQFDLGHAPQLTKYPELCGILPGARFTEDDMWNDFYANVIVVKAGVAPKAKPVNWHGYDSHRSPVIPLREHDNVFIPAEANWSGEIRAINAIDGFKLAKQAGADQ